LNTKALLDISIPLPVFEKQQWFEDIYAQVDCMRRIRAETNVEVNALLPSVLSRAFAGAL
jgi:type I restriction enzyme S subunit